MQFIEIIAMPLDLLFYLYEDDESFCIYQAASVHILQSIGSGRRGRRLMIRFRYRGTSRTVTLRYKRILKSPKNSIVKGILYLK